jgi:hypothetical protein
MPFSNQFGMVATMYQSPYIRGMSTWAKGSSGWLAHPTMIAPKRSEHSAGMPARSAVRPKASTLARAPKIMLKMSIANLIARRAPTMSTLTPSYRSWTLRKRLPVVAITC